MKKTLIAGLILVGIAVSGIALINNASAAKFNDQANPNFSGKSTGYERMIEVKAEILSISADELKQGLENKTFRELLEEKNIDLEEMRQKMQEKAMARWQEKGFSEEEIQERIEWQETRHAEGVGDCQANGLGRIGRNAGRFRK